MLSLSLDSSLFLVALEAAVRLSLALLSRPPCYMSSDSHSDRVPTSMAPVQFKGEIMDFDLGIEIDHRKRYDAAPCASG